MGWPTNLRLQPEDYSQIFDGPDRAKLQAWAKKYYDVKGTPDYDQYQIGDFIVFILNEGHQLSKPIRISLQEALEWQDVLDDHFRVHRGIRRKIERAISSALKGGETAGKNGTIDLDVQDDDTFAEDNIKDYDSGKDKAIIKLKSPRRRHKFHRDKK
jgi:hypothetical protein